MARVLRGLLLYRQPGTLQAFKPLQSYLQQRGTDFQLVPMDDLSTLDSLANEKLDICLTGTSLQSQEDSRFWQWCRQRKIWTVAFVDQWVNLDARFDQAIVMPDQLFVVDELVKQHYEDKKIPALIEVVGTPAWDGLAEIQKTRASSLRKPRPLMIFATEPASPVPGEPSFKAKNGFDDLDSLEMALQAAQSYAVSSGQTVDFEIKLHPIDQRSRLENHLTKLPGVHVSISNRSREECLQDADFVLGMRSIFLVEASLVGVPTVSFQPHRKTTSMATDREGIQVVTTSSEINGVFEKAQKNLVKKILGSSAEKIFRSFSARCAD